MPKDQETIEREHERGVWESLYGSDPSCKETLSATREAYTELFSKWHRNDIKGLWDELAQTAAAGEKFKYPFEYLDDVHPRAWDVISTYGKHYIPMSWKRQKPQEWRRQPRSRYCALNSIETIHFARAQEPRSRAVYVEGFVMGPLVNPMLHAWNGIGFTGKCVDWSFYASSPFTRYFGIPFTFEEYKFMTQKPESNNFTVFVLFRKDNFKRVEEKMLEVLKKSRTRLMRTKVV
jgi:hypothetical protein